MKKTIWADWAISKQTLPQIHDKNIFLQILEKFVSKLPKLPNGQKHRKIIAMKVPLPSNQYPLFEESNLMITDVKLGKSFMNCKTSRF